MLVGRQIDNNANMGFYYNVCREPNLLYFYLCKTYNFNLNLFPVITILNININKFKFTNFALSIS